tara:strand:+ start:468 stop:779 length:312 start_codon:yes stop_codon:yes gene_type:complete
MKYKFSEDRVLNMVKNHIDSTYNEHYSMEKIQSTEFIMDAGHGEGFCLGNIIKYAQRYGKKKGKNRDDILKIIHYAVILLGSIQEERSQDFHDYLDELQDKDE